MPEMTTMTPDPWESFSDEIEAAARWTEQQMDAAADEYAKEQIATAQSEQAFADNVKEYNRE